jgi:hypothetical protein
VATAGRTSAYPPPLCDNTVNRALTGGAEAGNDVGVTHSPNGTRLDGSHPLRNARPLNRPGPAGSCRLPASATLW